MRNANLIASLLFLPAILNLNAMEEKEQENISFAISDVYQMLVEVPSCKFCAACICVFNKKDITGGQLPDELVEFINKLRLILSTNSLSMNEKKFLINIINDHDIEINQFFSNSLGLSKKEYDLEYNDRQQLLNQIFINAIKMGDFELASFIFSEGADPNAKDYLGYTALYEAAGKNFLEMIRFLLLKGADVNYRVKRFTKETALHIAARKGYTKIVKLLLSYGALDYPDSEGNTAFMYAVLYGHKKIVKMLIAKSIDINYKNKQGTTALRLSVSYPEILKFLLEHGAIDIRNDDGYYALSLANELGFNDSVEILNNFNKNLLSKMLL